ncbi:MAG TPA: LytR C-terminal domain-containing protein [Elusimicrobiota bacterium]|nr:LytR C-terminal domain-containing protein [Elusimicrobiota bacterium]
MEHPRRALIVENGAIVEHLLAAALLAAALGAAWAESGSTLAARVREGRPWLAWVEARERGRPAPPSLLLAVYDPVPRRLRLIHVPGDLKLEPKGRRTLERAYLEALKQTEDPDAAARAAEDLAEAHLRELSPEPVPAVSARLVIELAPLEPEDEPSLEAARELKARGRRFRTWLALTRRAFRGLLDRDRSGLDALLFALELRRVPLEKLEPARLPADDLAPDFLGRLLSTEPPPENARPATAEVLNGAGAPGLASRAAKVLRSKGVDVLTTASAPPRARTLVYDRIGDFARAEKARAALGCPDARTATRLDPSRAVDVSVELGLDCASDFGTGESREP